MSRWVVVATYPGRHIAEMMGELLRREGIEAVVEVDDAGGLRPDLALTLGAKLKVAVDQLERARELLSDPEAEETDS